MILLGIILFFVIVAIVLFKTETPVYLDDQNKPITTQDGLEDVVIDEKTVHVKTYDKERIKEEVIEATIITTDDFVKEETVNDTTTEEFKNNIGGKKLTEHIAEIIQLNPNSKKHLTKRHRKTVDKVVKEKK
jgi:hypothetical protein